MLSDVAADIGGMKHGISEQININAQWKVINPSMNLQEFSHAYAFANEKKIRIRRRLVISHSTGAKKDNLIHGRASLQHRRNHGALFLSQAIIHHLQGS